MERQAVVQALTACGFRESGPAFYGSVEGYPIMIQVPGKEHVQAVTAAFTVQPAPSGVQRRAAAKALKEQAGLNQMQGKTVILTWQERKGHRLEEIGNLLHTAALTLNSYRVEAPEDRCPICRQPACDCYVRYDGRYEPAHQCCLHQLEAETRHLASANQGSYILGVVGGLVGGLAGMIPTVLSICLLERIWSLLYALIPLGVYYGYKLCGGKMNKAALATSIVISILDVYVLQLVLLAIGLMTEYQCTMMESLQLIWQVMGDGAFWASVTKESMVSFLFLALGIWIAWNQISRTHKSDLQGIQAAVATVTLKEGAEPLAQIEEPVQDQTLQG